MNMSVSFPGIKKIFTLNALHLQKNIVSAHLAMLPITVLCDLRSVDFVGEATLSVDSSDNGHGISEKSTLEFRSKSKLELDKQSAWIVSLVSGDAYLIGTADPKYPIVECSHYSGQKDGAPNIYTYKISHIGKVSAIPIVL